MQKNDIPINFPFLFEIDNNKYELTYYKLLWILFRTWTLYYFF